MLIHSVVSVEEGWFYFIVFSASEGENVGGAESDDSEEDPEKSGDWSGSVSHPFVDVGSAVVRNWAVLYPWEGSILGGRSITVAGTPEVSFNSLEGSDGVVEVFGLGVVSVLKSSGDGLVSLRALGDSVSKLGVVRGIVHNGPWESELLVLPPVSI